MLILFILPFLYIGLSSGVSSVMPPVDYKAISQENSLNQIGKTTKPSQETPSNNFVNQDSSP